jgi:hypothetical protein
MFLYLEGFLLSTPGSLYIMRSFQNIFVCELQDLDTEAGGESS